MVAGYEIVATRTDSGQNDTLCGYERTFIMIKARGNAIKFGVLILVCVAAIGVGSTY